jgi:hypothetical protein
MIRAAIQSCRRIDPLDQTKGGADGGKASDIALIRFRTESLAGKERADRHDKPNVVFLLGT